MSIPGPQGSSPPTLMLLRRTPPGYGTVWRGRNPLQADQAQMQGGGASTARAVVVASTRRWLLEFQPKRIHSYPLFLASK